jgi:site-specific recombinase XerD
MVISIGAIGQFRGFHEMITGQLSLPWPFGLPHRIERYAFQAGRRGFESPLPLHQAQRGDLPQKMAIYTLLPKYVLDAKAQGMTDKSIAHVRLAVKLFAEFLGDIPDVRQVTDDDLRRFVVALQQKTKWVGLPQDKGQKLSGTSINTYVRGVKRYWSWLERKQIIQQNPLRSVVTPKLPNRLPKVLTEEQLEAIFKVIEAKDAHTLSFCGARDMAIFMLLLDSGIRLTELTGLDPE